MRWADEKLDELMNKPKDTWNADDYEAYHYIQQLNFESGCYDD